MRSTVRYDRILMGIQKGRANGAETIGFSPSIDDVQGYEDMVLYHNDDAFKVL